MTSTQISAPRRGRHLRTAFGALATAVALAGCAAFSPMSTQEIYNPGDGISVNIGAVQVRDLLVVGTEQGEPATILAYVVNNSPDDVTLTLTSEGATPATVEVPAGTATQISPAGEDGVTLDSLNVVMGALVPITVQVDSDPPALVGVPTLSTSSPLYSEYGMGES